MAFNDEVTKDGRGRALRLDVSLDGWATVAYRYGSVAGQLDGTNWYDARILNEPSVRRALGNNRIATSGGCELVLANPDGGVDWLCGRESISTASKARFKLYVVLFDPAAPTTFTSKLLGDFFCGEWPRQTPSEVRVSLADAFMAPLARGAQLPTIADWAAVGTPITNPLRAGAGNGLPSYGLPDSLSDDTPIQLAFGEDWVEAMPPILMWENTTYATEGAPEGRYGSIIVPLYCTTSNAVVSQSLISELRVSAMVPQLSASGDDQVLLDIPRSLVQDAWSATPSTFTIWSVEKSPAIIKGGRTFYVVYLSVSATLGPPGTEFDLFYGVWAPPVPAPEDWSVSLAARRTQYKYAGGYPTGAVDWNSLGGLGSSYATHASRVMQWWVKGLPLSARTTSGPQQHAVDVMTDLVEHYSPGSLSVDTTTAARVKTGTRFARAAGVVYPWHNFRPDVPPPSMRQTLSALAQSSDIDVFVDWDGEISFASDIWDTTTATQAATLPTVAETRQGSIERWLAGEGERGAPWNRVYLEGGKASPADGRDAPGQGPFDFAFPADGLYVLQEDRIIELVLQQGWRPWAQQAQSPVYWRGLDARARDRIRFVTSLDGLRIDLGDYFKLEWTDNRGAPYASAVVCQCEAITYLAQSDEVEIEAIWRDDSTNARNGYLLDDETLLVRTKTDTSTLDLSVGNLITMNNLGMAWGDFGVVPGDIIVVRDSTETATGFDRHQAFRIVSLDTDQEATVSPAPAASVSGILNADWYVVAGATTYAQAAEDIAPASYADGVEMYGKVTDTDGEFSDTTTGNRLING